eukprot:2944283-Amphidinium_carterae.1
MELLWQSSTGWTDGEILPPIRHFPLNGGSAELDSCPTKEGRPGNDINSTLEWNNSLQANGWALCPVERAPFAAPAEQQRGHSPASIALDYQHLSMIEEHSDLALIPKIFGTCDASRDNLEKQYGHCFGVSPAPDRRLFTQKGGRVGLFEYAILISRP